MIQFVTNVNMVPILQIKKSVWGCVHKMDYLNLDIMILIMMDSASNSAQRDIYLVISACWLVKDNWIIIATQESLVELMNLI